MVILSLETTSFRSMKLSRAAYFKLCPEDMPTKERAARWAKVVAERNAVGEYHVIVLETSENLGDDRAFILDHLAETCELGLPDADWDADDEELYVDRTACPDWDSTPSTALPSPALPSVPTPAVD